MRFCVLSACLQTLPSKIHSLYYSTSEQFNACGTLYHILGTDPEDWGVQNVCGEYVGADWEELKQYGV